MTTPDDLLPADLAVDAPPLSDAELEAFYDEWVTLASDAGIDLAPALALMEDSAPGRWRIEDDSAAEWAGRRLALAQAAVDYQTELATEWKRKIDLWLAQVTGTQRRTVDYMTDRLGDYAVRRREAGGSPTLSLPSVTVKTSDRKPKATVEDDELLAGWIEGALLNGGPRQEPWVKALLEHGHDVEDVVQRKAKVYVGPLRDLVTLGVRTDGYEMHTTLACGHTLVEPVEGMSTPETLHAVGEMVPCGECMGVAAAYEIVLVAVTEPVVLGPDGEPIPGATVDPGGMSVKVSTHG